MQRRMIWIIGGSILGVLLVLCLVLGGFAWFITRQAQRQQQVVTDTLATITAELEAASVIASPETTAIPRPAATAEGAAPSVVAASPSDASAPVTAMAEARDTEDVAAALVPEGRAILSQRANATLYQIDAVLDPEQHTISGEQTVRLTNTEGVALDELYFRLYVNAPHYNEAGIAVTAVEVDGVAATAALEADETALRITLPQPLQADTTAEFRMRFTTTVPQSGGGYGIFKASDGVFALYSWHPEVAVYEEGGWQLNPVAEQGDPTNTDASNYEVSFGTPKGFVVITSGTDIGQTDETSPTVRHHSVGALARNFVVVASDRYEQTTRQVGGTKVSSYYLPGNAQGG